MGKFKQKKIRCFKKKKNTSKKLNFFIFVLKYFNLNCFVFVLVSPSKIIKFYKKYS